MSQESFFKKIYRSISIKDLYFLFTLLNSIESNDKKVYNVKTLYKHIFLLSKTEKLKTKTNLDLIFLNIFFFTKTSNVVSISKKTEKASYYVFINRLMPTVLLKDSLWYRLTIFWEKWKKLHRPSTDKDILTTILTFWEKKIQCYTDLGFIKNIYIYFPIRAKVEKLSKNLVYINRKLLTSPKYSSSSISKIISLENSKNFEFQFLRKNKVYNKGRYSRCRQNYRTGVYMCMYLSVVSIFGLYYWFFKFSFNFTYLWWLFIAFIGSFFLPKIIKYRLYEPYTLFTKAFEFFKWFFLIIKSIFI